MNGNVLPQTAAPPTAIVTGGAGALGAAIVQALLEGGWRVSVPYRRETEFEALSAGLRDAHGERLSGAVVDLTDEGAVDGYVAAVAGPAGFDLLVNSAGGFAGGSPVHETPWSVWQKQLDLNLKTAVLASRAAVPGMIRRGGGSIVNVSSRPATQSGANLGAYAASKRAILALTDAMAAELTDARITVNAILPSTIDTPANRASSPGADFSKWVAPADIARVVLLLAGPDARIVSGAHLPVYGRA
jgi:NAD(P)-dependent dehydrogenase (short-subunit alcohol dehydrogenase family)